MQFTAGEGRCGCICQFIDLSLSFRCHCKEWWSYLWEMEVKCTYVIFKICHVVINRDVRSFLSNVLFGAFSWKVRLTYSERIYIQLNGSFPAYNFKNIVTVYGKSMVCWYCLNIWYWGYCWRKSTMAQCCQVMSHYWIHCYGLNMDK